MILDVSPLALLYRQNYDQPIRIAATHELKSERSTPVIDPKVFD